MADPEFDAPETKLIFIRRLLAILLIPIFLVFFTLSTVRSGIDHTVLDESFLTDQLEEQDLNITMIWDLFLTMLASMKMLRGL